MPIVETMGIALVACGIPVLLLQQFELRRLAREGARDRTESETAH